MRILYVSRTFTTHDRRFLTAITAAGHEAGFLRLHDDGVQYDARPLPDGVTPLTWPSPVDIDNPAAALDNAPLLARVIEQFRPHLIQAGPIQTGALMAALSGFRPMIGMSWGSDILVDADRDDDWRRATLIALQHAQFVICDCDAVRLRAQILTSLPSESFIQLPWGIDLPAYAVPVSRHDSGQVRIASVRSWDAVYGIDTVIEAFRLARARDPRLQLVLGGDGPLASDVSRWIAQSGVADVIQRPGRLDSAELVHLMQDAHLYLSCSASDGTSISLLEAMATGLVPVVTDAPSNREWIQAPEFGFLAPKGDAGAFADALVRAASMAPAARAALVAHNRLQVEQRADWSRNVARLHAAYEMLARSA